MEIEIDYLRVKLVSINLNVEIMLKLVALTFALLSFKIGQGAPIINSNKPSIEGTQITYPEQALKNNIEGKVVVYFEVSCGAPNNISVSQTVDSVLSTAAIEVVNGFSKEYLETLERTGKTGFLLPVDFEII